MNEVNRFFINKNNKRLTPANIKLVSQYFVRKKLPDVLYSHSNEFSIH